MAADAAGDTAATAPAPTAAAAAAAANRAERRDAVKKAKCKPALEQLHIELVKPQRHFIDGGDKVLVVLEGRAAAGMDARLAEPDARVVFEIDEPCLRDGRLAA